ncbi:uncharacterized protein LOC141631019 [Silene latifolia]|uniref:uncharacterized protein LOC141631019 n=1 Tax=Silene latifolia TaxID=37657 RepID=UPI003D782BCD
MRQRRWIELIGEYDMEIVYHEGNANVVADALSKKSIHALCSAMSRVKLEDELEKMGICVIRNEDSVGDLTIEPELYAEIREWQKGDPRVEKWRTTVVEGVTSRFAMEKGNNMICVIVDRLTKTTYFIPMNDTWSKAELAKDYVRYIVKLHGIPKDILSDRDSRFISKFW